VATFQKAIDLGTNSIAVYVRKGISLYTLKKYEDAILSFEEAIKIDNTFVFAYLWIARSHLAMNNKEKALEYYNKVLELDPDNEDALDDMKYIQNKEE
jgi:serine/threonine-protein kinase